MSQKLTLSGPHIIKIDDASDWHIRSNKWSRDKRRFTRIPLITTKNSRHQTPDLLDLMGQLSKGARDLFLAIKCGMDYRNHLAWLPNSDLKPSQRNLRSRAIKELETIAAGLACRVPTSGITNLNGIEQRFRPSTYMISPHFLFPAPKYEEEIHEIWKQCIQARSGKRSVLPQDTPSQLQIDQDSPLGDLLKMPTGPVLTETK